MSSLPVVFEDCSETDARRVSVFELIKSRQALINERRRHSVEKADMQTRIDGLVAHVRDRQESVDYFFNALKAERFRNTEDQNELFRLRRLEASLDGPKSDFKPLTFWRAVGLIALGVALGASFVAFGLPKAHAQGYRMPDYAAPPPVIQYQPLTPPNSLQQGEPQSFSVIPYGSGQSDGLGQLEGSGGDIVNQDGSVVGSYVVTP